MTGLREHLKAKQITQRAFAGVIGVSAAYLSEIASGVKIPSLDLAVRIQRATDGAVPADSWIAPQDMLRQNSEEDAA